MKILGKRVQILSLKTISLDSTLEILDCTAFLKKVNEHASYQMTVNPNFRISDGSSIDGYLRSSMIKEVLNQKPLCLKILTQSVC